MTKETSTARILIAEDNHINGVLAKRMLNKIGLQADIATNGIEAISAIQKGQYEIVLMDIQMPEMDGIEATSWILTHCEASPPKIIAMTANTLPADQKRYQHAGMVDLIGKPLELDEIRKVITRWIR